VIDSSNIAWPSDLEHKFANTNNLASQWENMENQHFIVWMRTAGLPDFRKLYGKISQNLAAGAHTATVLNYYDVSSFAGAKYFVLSTAGPFGGKNSFLGISYIVVGCICIAVAGFFLVRWLQIKSKKNT